MCLKVGYSSEQVDPLDQGLTKGRYRWNRIPPDGRREPDETPRGNQSNKTQRANGLRIDKLSADYLNVTTATYLYAEDYEAPAIYKSGSTYFMFASHESGWCK